MGESVHKVSLVDGCVSGIFHECLTHSHFNSQAFAHPNPTEILILTASQTLQPSDEKTESIVKDHSSIQPDKALDGGPMFRYLHHRLRKYSNEVIQQQYRHNDHEDEMKHAPFTPMNGAYAQFVQIDLIQEDLKRNIGGIKERSVPTIHGFQNMSCEGETKENQEEKYGKCQKRRQRTLKSADQMPNFVVMLDNEEKCPGDDYGSDHMHIHNQTSHTTRFIELTDENYLQKHQVQQL